FVTRHGELLDRDGRLVVGPHTAALGLMSRRTELRELHDRIEQSRQQLRNSEQRLTQVQSTQQAHQIRIGELRQQRNQLAEALSAARAHEASVKEKVTQLGQQQTSAADEHAVHTDQIRQGESQLKTARERLTTCESEIKHLEQVLASGRDWIAQEEEQLESYRVVANEAELAAARAEQQVEALAAQTERMRREQNERTEGLVQAQTEASRSAERQQMAELTILRASAENNERMVQLEIEQVAVGEQSHRLEQLRSERQTANEEANRVRDVLRQAEQRLHQIELEAERLRNELDNLAGRLNEDYGITVADLQRQLTPEEQAERDQVDAEIEELRRKLSQLGAVNMDALSELQELESRHTGLDEQYRDLIDAKEALEKIIHKIDADSRRLFTETLEAIRSNFGVLFRKVFGGGRADIVLEEDVDILESGIDIVATPPGKQSLGLSLLSGGERALTAVTLLMAVFQYRPSPFCVLDEVDGPLDEANIGRFVDVLNEFLAWTKFVVVTHSKKTMTTAHTLYGVTMQESGVSKRVSVRFEEVGEHGEISDTALQRSNDDAA
ncbi:MAG: chromosome segregation protein SMC, partial [Planctomycetota bacterium]